MRYVLPFLLCCTASLICIAAEFWLAVLIFLGLAIYIAIKDLR